MRAADIRVGRDKRIDEFEDSDVLLALVDFEPAHRRAMKADADNQREGGACSQQNQERPPRFGPEELNRYKRAGHLSRHRAIGRTRPKGPIRNCLAEWWEMPKKPLILPLVPGCPARPPG